jgi:D-3-phosphoglycerate dehydrogenase
MTPGAVASWDGQQEENVARHKVVIAEQIADAGIEALRESCDVVVLVGEPRERVMGELATASALIVRSTTKVDDEMIAAAPDLAVIGRAGIGVDNIDIESATRHGVMVVNAPDANTISAAEHTMALLLSQARHVARADRSLREHRWDRKQFVGVELHGKTLGILGLGKIGTYVAKRAAAFDMRIIAFDPYVSLDRARRLEVEMMPLDDVLSSADFITIHLPRTPQTENLINAASIARMRDGVRIVNVARGGIVSEVDLAEAIVSGKIAGAAVDVFDGEPKTESPLFDLPQVTVTPHLGASTREAQERAGVSVAESVELALAGEMVLSAVNVDLGAPASPELKPYIRLTEQLGQIFTALAKGLPDELTVTVRGELAEEPIEPITLSALKGVLASTSEIPVSYVNAPHLADSHGMSVVTQSQLDVDDYQSVIRLTGDVGERNRTIAGTYMERKGAVLVGVDGYAIEVPLTDHMLLVRNDDTPGCIGRVGTYLGDRGYNISDMVVGRKPGGVGAMMGIALDAPMSEADAAGILTLTGIGATRYIDLT